MIAAICSTLVLSEWISQRIRQELLRYSGASTALLISGVIEPLVQRLATGNELDSQTRSALDALHNESALGRDIVATKIWRPDGTIIYSNKFDQTDENLRGAAQLWPALNGEVAATLIELQSPERETENRAGFPLLRFFAPIREASGDRVIAIAEVYRLAASLETDLRSLRQHSWLAAATVTISTIGLLCFVVYPGSQTISRQRSALDRQLREIDHLRQFNKTLLLRLKDVHKAAADRNEEFLRRVGTDLHDGPAQHVAFALLRIDALRPALAAAQIKSSELEKLRKVLQESHQEIRNAARGLFFPRELEDATIAETVKHAVRNHARRTGTRVRCSIGKMPEHVSRQLQICVYRLVQEGLSNAFRHAAGRSQQVRVSCDGIRIHVEIADKGPGCSPESMRTGRGLGLISLRHRVESLGGVFFLDSSPGAGTRLQSTFFIANPGVRCA
jgi:signal transduction histidine kinase